jgi:putative transposase
MSKGLTPVHGPLGHGVCAVSVTILPPVPASPAYGATVVGMPRPLRGDLPDGILHVTTRGVWNRLVYLDDDDRRTFLSVFALVVHRHLWDCHAFCLMGTHYHLVVETTIERLSAGMQYLNGDYAQRFNRRHDRDGHVFGARFAAWTIRDDEHYGRTLEYVLANPVRAGLVDDWADWPWSAARGFEGSREHTFGG